MLLVVVSEGFCCNTAQQKPVNLLLILLDRQEFLLYHTQEQVSTVHVVAVTSTYWSVCQMWLSRRLWRKALMVPMGRTSFWCFRLSMKEMSLEVSRCEVWQFWDGGSAGGCLWFKVACPVSLFITPRGWSQGSCRQDAAEGRCSGSPWSSRQTKSLAAGLTPWK